MIPFIWGENWPIEPDFAADVASTVAAHRNRRRVMVGQAVALNTCLEALGAVVLKSAARAYQRGKPCGMEASI